ncbi:MAG: hypothetical protein SFW35_08425 [Chitinophagales bacterium]|nr:hypothetical protein [Chitinophagales bacterium]
MYQEEDDFRTLTVKEKALKVNLDERIYGSFAEIGAGQEIAANFFKAGGSSGTIAKTMSAYDMRFSDAIYGKSERYVSEPRLNLMLQHEYDLLGERLEHRKSNTCFFSLADTIETLNFKRTNRGHGWLGLRFQLSPETPPNDCVLHIVMHDNDNISQQQAIGIVGVNLLYGCYYLYQDPEALLNSLVDNLQPGRIEVDMFRLTGPDFQNVDNRLMSLKLVKNGLTNATMFGSDGNVLQPSEALYKKNVLVLRGRFRPVTKVSMDMLTTAKTQFLQELDIQREEMLLLSELTLTALNPQGNIDEKDFLDRVDILCSLGQTVMISNFREFYKLAHYMSGYTRNKKLGIILGFNTLDKIFDNKYYSELRGGILESFGILFGNNVKLYVYPTIDSETGQLLTLQDFAMPVKLAGLFQYLKDNDKIEDLKGANKEVMHIISDNVLAMLKTAEPGWEDLVPPQVINMIKIKCLFDYPCSLEEKQKAEALERQRIAEEQARASMNQA